MTTKINKQLGTKWFTFYAKVRPWLSCFMALTVLIDFFEYSDIYFEYWWMLIYLMASIAVPIVNVIVFIKSNGDYREFVDFIKITLIIDIVCISYQNGVKQYLESGFGVAFIVFAIILVLGYFLWYKLNIEYFEKRILHDTCEPKDCNNNFIISEAPKTNEIYKINKIDTYIDKTIPQTEKTQNIIQKPKFCRFCGNKLLDDSIYCNKCGEKVVIFIHNNQGE